MSVLLLDVTLQPLRVISVKRALILFLSEKVEILEEDQNTSFRSERLWINIPQVVRLKYFVQIPYHARVPLTKAAVLRRDHGRCAYCEPHKGTTVDHIVPRSRGGKHEWMNVVACCASCNACKANKLLSELGWKIRFHPYQPADAHWLLIGVKEQANVLPAWEAYINA